MPYLPYSPLCSTLLVALLSLAGLNSVVLHAGDEVTLSNGLIIVGEVLTSDEADPIRVRVQEGSIKAILSYPATEVVAIARGANHKAAAIATLREELAQFAAIPPPNRQAWWQTILKFDNMDEQAEFKVAAQNFIAFFPNHALARKALGQELYNGEWLSAAEIKMAQGLSYYDGAWRSEAEIDALEEATTLARAEKQKARDLRKARRQMMQEAARIRASNNASSYFPAHPLDRSGRYAYYQSANNSSCSTLVSSGSSPYASHSYDAYQYPTIGSISAAGGSSRYQFQFHFSFP